MSCYTSPYFYSSETAPIGFTPLESPIPDQYYIYKSPDNFSLSDNTTYNRGQNITAPLINNTQAEIFNGSL